MTLYLKYRPKNLDQLDLTQVSESIKKILASESLPHAFLFSGPRGTGKTSAARILAKVVNCEHLGKDGAPCDECGQCKSITSGSNLDVIEMDAASHRGIEDVRVLRDAVKLTPTKSKKKVYIIDEAHMLTTEASNALLKTLEEPPSHVIFILATTNPEKLIDTIKSRTTNIAFRKATDAEIMRSLKRVVDGEKIKISEENLEKIAKISGGAFRDAIKILEQYSLEGEELMATFDSGSVQEFLNLLAEYKEKEAIELIEANIAKGISVDFFYKSLLELLHKALLGEAGVGTIKIATLKKDELITLFHIFSDTSKNFSESPIEQLALEVGVIKWCEKKAPSAPVKDDTEKTEKKVDSPSPPTPDPVKADLAGQSAQSGTVDDLVWKDILMAVRPVNASIEGLLRSSRPMGYDGRTLTLGVFYKFHKERLEDARHRRILEEVMAKVLNSPTRVVCTLVEPPEKKISEAAKVSPVLTETNSTDIIKAAEEIFGN